MEHLGFHYTDFHDVSYMGICLRICWHISSFIKVWQEWRLLYTKTILHFIVSFSVLLRMRNVSDKICREKQNSYFMISNYIRKSCCSWDNVEKYSTAGQATVDNITHAHCVLDKQIYRHPHIIRNIYCYFTATIVARRHLIVTLQYIACFIFINVEPAKLALSLLLLNLASNFASHYNLPLEASAPAHVLYSRHTHGILVTSLVYHLCKCVWSSIVRVLT
jgi:hypothetical protein